MRTTSIRRAPILALALLLAACAAADPSPSSAPDAPGTALPSSVAVASPEPTTMPAPTPTPPPQPSGTLLVWQLDGLNADTPTTESIYRLDVANGATTPVNTIPVNEMTCCPTSVTFSRDHTTAFLYAGNYRGAVDLATGTFTKASGRIPRGYVAISPSGDRLAWVDDVTGTSESIVIAGRDGRSLQRVELPAGAFASVPAWMADDEALLVTTLLPVKTASDVRLASTIACCSIDRGTQATHLLVVPLDGSSIRDVYDDTTDVLATQNQPSATPPPGMKGGFAWPASHTLRAFSGPDVRSALVVSEDCPSHWRNDRTAICADHVITVDTETGSRTTLPTPLTTISSAGWSPDGRRLSLLGSEGGGPTGLYILDRTSGTLVDLGPAEPELMAWSGDGAWIAYWQLDPKVPDGGDRVQVWVAPTTGGDARFVAAHASAGWLEP